MIMNDNTKIIKIQGQQTSNHFMKKSTIVPTLLFSVLDIDS